MPDPGSNPYVFDRPVGQLPCFVGRQALLVRLQQLCHKQPFVALLGGPKSGVSSTLQRLARAWEDDLKRPQAGTKVVPVYLDLRPLSLGAETLSAGALMARFVAALYQATSAALSNPFVQAHRDALRLPKLEFGRVPGAPRQAPDFDPFADYLALCRIIWQSLAGTPGFCRTVLLLDHADLLLQPALQGLIGPLHDLLVPPPPPPPPAEPRAPSARELARTAPRKGARDPRVPPTLQLPAAPGRASKKRRELAAATAAAGDNASNDRAAASSDAAAGASPHATAATQGSAARNSAGRGSAGRGFAAPGFAAPGSAGWGSAAPGSAGPGSASPGSAAAAAARRRPPPRRIGQQAQGPTVAPGVRPARHLAPGAERPLALICGGGVALLRELERRPSRGRLGYLQVPPLWRTMVPMPQPALSAEEVDSLVALGDFAAAPRAAQWCAYVAGGHPYALQAALHVLDKLLRSAPELHDEAADPEGTALLGALQEQLIGHISGPFSAMLQAFPAPTAAADAPREHTLMRTLIAHDGAPVPLTELSAAVGHLPLRPALEVLLILAVAQRQVRGNVECVTGNCPLWNGFYAQN